MTPRHSSRRPPLRSRDRVGNSREKVERILAEHRESPNAMFASNFPVDKVYGSFAQTYGAFDEVTRAFSADERRKLFCAHLRVIALVFQWF